MVSYVGSFDVLCRPMNEELSKLMIYGLAWRVVVAPGSRDKARDAANKRTPEQRQCAGRDKGFFAYRIAVVSGAYVRSRRPGA